MSQLTQKKEETNLDETQSKSYVLILWNDDINSFDWVIRCLIEVCGHEYEQAEQCSIIIHNSGKCDIKHGYLEVLGEMYQKLKGAGLTVTLESI